MDAGVVWGIIITIYIALGLPALSAANNGPRPDDAVPGSVKMSKWNRKEARAQKMLVAWCIGFAFLMGAWLVMA